MADESIDDHVAALTRRLREMRKLRDREFGKITQPCRGSWTIYERTIKHVAELDASIAVLETALEED
jgi:hypothetical protein